MKGPHGEGASPIRVLGLLAALAGLLAALFLIGLAVGSVTIPLREAAGSLIGLPAADPVWDRILWQIRLPRCLTAVLAGSALALSGLEMQTLFRNPLAGPFSMGISSGATLGVALAVLAGAAAGADLTGYLALRGIGSQLGVAGSAVAGSAAVMMLVLAVARRIQSNTTLLILGLMFGQVAGAMVSVLQSFSTSEEIRAFTFWGFGSYAGVTWAQMPVLAGAVLAGSAIGIYCAKPLNALLLGWTYARSLGVPVRALRLLLLASTSILAGAVTAFCGPVAFLGLAVPHLCRGLFRTADHRILIPACLLLGASLSLGSDLASRLPGSDRALPLNAVTALVGAPVVIWVLLRRRAPRDE
ncbi:MAG: transport system permease protein [Fibrobacteres bacterium]|nr:transport system permease protein [Fibrobacterota bacterium]